MQKRLLLKISILTMICVGVAGGLRGESVFADEIKTPDGVRMWTADTLMSFDNKLEAEKDEVCGDDNDCRINLYFEQMERGEEFRAVDSFKMHQIAITGINPEEGYFKYVYHDEDPMMSLWGGGEKRIIKSIGIAWLDTPRAIDPTNTSVLTDAHYLLNEYFDEFAAQPVANVEQKIYTPLADLSANVSGRIEFWTTEGEYGSMFGEIDYSSCLNSPKYGSGTECVAYYDECGNVKYLFKGFYDEDEESEDVTEELEEEIAEEEPEEDKIDEGEPSEEEILEEKSGEDFEQELEEGSGEDSEKDSKDDSAESNSGDESIIDDGSSQEIAMTEELGKEDQSTSLMTLSVSTPNEETGTIAEADNGDSVRENADETVTENKGEKSENTNEEIELPNTNENEIDENNYALPITVAVLALGGCGTALFAIIKQKKV